MIASQVVSEANASMAVRKSFYSMNQCLKPHRLRRKGFSSYALKSSCSTNHEPTIGFAHRSLSTCALPKRKNSVNGTNPIRGRPIQINPDDTSNYIRRKTSKLMEPVYRPLYPCKRPGRRGQVTFTVRKKLPYVPAALLTRRKPVRKATQSTSSSKSQKFLWPPIYNCKRQKEKKIREVWSEMTDAQTQYPSWLMPIYACKNSGRGNKSDETLQTSGLVANRKIDMYLRMKEIQKWKKTIVDNLTRQPATIVKHQKTPKASQSVLDLKKKIAENRESKEKSSIGKSAYQWLRPEHKTPSLKKPEQPLKKEAKPSKKPKTPIEKNETDHKGQPKELQVQKEVQVQNEAKDQNSKCAETELVNNEWTVESLKERIKTMKRGETERNSSEKTKSKLIQKGRANHRLSRNPSNLKGNRDDKRISDNLLMVSSKSIQNDVKRRMSTSTLGISYEENKSKRLLKSAAFKRLRKMSSCKGITTEGSIRPLKNDEVQIMKTKDGSAKCTEKGEELNAQNKIDLKLPLDGQQGGILVLPQIKCSHREYKVPIRKRAHYKKVTKKHSYNPSSMASNVLLSTSNPLVTIQRDLNSSSRSNGYYGRSREDNNLRPTYNSTMTKGITNDKPSAKKSRIRLTAPNKVVHPVQSDVSSAVLKKRVDSLKMLIEKSRGSPKFMKLVESDESTQSHREMLQRLLKAVKTTTTKVTIPKLGESVENNLLRQPTMTTKSGVKSTDNPVRMAIENKDAFTVRKEEQQTPKFQNILDKLKSFVSTAKETSQSLQETLINVRFESRIKSKNSSRKLDENTDVKTSATTSEPGITYGQVRGLLAKGMCLFQHNSNIELGDDQNHVGEQKLCGTTTNPKTPQRAQSCSYSFPKENSKHDRRAEAITALVPINDDVERSVQSMPQKPTSVAVSQCHFTFDNANGDCTAHSTPGTRVNESRCCSPLKPDKPLSGNGSISASAFERAIQSIRREIRDALRIRESASEARSYSVQKRRSNEIIGLTLKGPRDEDTAMNNCGVQINHDPEQWGNHSNSQNTIPAVTYSCQQGSMKYCNCGRANCCQCQLLNHENNCVDYSEPCCQHKWSTIIDNLSPNVQTDSEATEAKNAASADWGSMSDELEKPTNKTHSVLRELQSKDPMINAEVLKTLKLPVTFDELNGAKWCKKK